MNLCIKSFNNIHYGIKISLNSSAKAKRNMPFPTKKPIHKSFHIPPFRIGILLTPSLIKFFFEQFQCEHHIVRGEFIRNADWNRDNFIQPFTRRSAAMHSIKRLNNAFLGGIISVFGSVRLVGYPDMLSLGIISINNSRQSAHFFKKRSSSLEVPVNWKALVQCKKIIKQSMFQKIVSKRDVR